MNYLLSAQDEFPAFYEPDQIGTLYAPDITDIAAAAQTADLPPARHDREKVHLVIIDMQVDFCHPTGSLYVPGAEEDIERLSAFIFHHAAAISRITCTLDSHLPIQIFHPYWWVNEAGEHPEPLTVISQQAVQAGTWRPFIMPGYSTEYVARLEKEAKKQLIIWPYHVLIGGAGHILDPTLWSVVQWHSLARQTQPVWLPKGTVPHSEHYSAVQPEVAVPGHPQGGKDEAFLNSLRQSDHILVAGEAASHCVLETLADLVVEFADEPDLLQRIYVLQDCMSPVRHPDIDFEALTQTQFEQFAEAGIHLIDSTEPLPFWATAV